MIVAAISATMGDKSKGQQLRINLTMSTTTTITVSNNSGGSRGSKSYYYTLSSDCHTAHCSQLLQSIGEMLSKQSCILPLSPIDSFQGHFQETKGLSSPTWWRHLSPVKVKVRQNGNSRPLSTCFSATIYGGFLHVSIRYLSLENALTLIKIMKLKMLWYKMAWGYARSEPWIATATK